MTIRLVHKDWSKEFVEALRMDSSQLLIVSPFIQAGALDQPAGALVRGVKKLHAKLYIFGESRAILTSANLTETALDKNHELGFVVEDKELLASCRFYFKGLWDRAKPLSPDWIKAWDEAVRKHASRVQPHLETLGKLPDYGAHVEIVANAKQALARKQGRGRVTQRWKTLKDAFAYFGAVKKYRWSWSGRSEDGKTVVVTLWKDQLKHEAGLTVFDCRGDSRLHEWRDRPGNKERLQNLMWARDHCGGLFRVVITIRDDIESSIPRIVDRYPDETLVMRLVGDPDEDTGEFRAESVQ
jgi:hypothetical protein